MAVEVVKQTLVLFGVLKKSESDSECVSNREHSRLIFLKTHSHTHSFCPAVMRSWGHAV